MGLLALFLIDAIAAVNPYVSPLAAEVDGLYIRWQDGEVVMGPLEPEAFQEYSAPRRGYSRYAPSGG